MSSTPERARRRLPFTNRISILHEINTVVDRVRADPACLQFIGLIGLGGCGKSRLLEKIREEITATDVDVVWVALDDQSFGHSLTPLLSIRHSLANLQCLLFDSALARYAAARGRLYQLVANEPAPNSDVFTAIDVALKLAGYALPAIPWDFAAKMLVNAEQQLNRQLHYHKSDFEEIDSLANAPEELYERFPYYLGTDLQTWHRIKKRGLVLLYDAYDKQRLSETRDADWLATFIETVGFGAHIVAARDSLYTSGVYWPAALREYDVTPLEEQYCRDLIQRVADDASPPVISRIVEVSQGIPLILTACINEYLTLRGRIGSVSPDMLSDTPTTAIKRFFDHLSEPERELMVTLATVQFFDADLLRAIARVQRAGSALLTTVANLFFIQHLEGGVFKVHDIVTAFIRRDASTREQRIGAIEVVIHAIRDRVQLDEPPQRLLSMFVGILQATAAGDPLPIGAVESLIDVGYFFYDHGLWSDLIDIASKAELASPETGGLIAQFFRALSLRRVRSIDMALEQLYALRGSRSRFGRHADSIDLEIAYLDAIASRYADARRGFAALHARSKPFDPHNRVHVHALLYHADMLVLDGSLNTGADLILEAAQHLPPSARNDWAEYIRLRGHAFRFSLLFEEAEAIYTDALRAGKEVGALAAKLQTNIAESLCWAEPHDAISACHLALDANEQLGSRIEIGKNHAALCIALAGTGRYSESRHHYNEAKRLATAVQYPAGALFAEIAGCALAVATGDSSAYSAHYLIAQEHTERFGTYGHLLLLPAVLGGREREAQDIANRYEWIEHGDILRRAAAVAQRFTPR